MLVLSRKQGQSIVVGNDIVVTVKEIRGKTVRLSIETPAGVPVFREEIHKEILAENRRAALDAVATERMATAMLPVPASVSTPLQIPFGQNKGEPSGLGKLATRRKAPETKENP
jgi:carbon storage regulator